MEAISVVTDRLTKLSVPYETIPHEQAYTPIDEALALDISADEVLKTIVLDTSSGHALAVIPGSRRLDISAAERALGTKHVRLATEDEIDKDFPGYEFGALPLGSLHGAPTYVEQRSAARHGRVRRWNADRVGQGPDRGSVPDRARDDGAAHATPRGRRRSRIGQGDDHRELVAARIQAIDGVGRTLTCLVIKF